MNAILYRVVVTQLRYSDEAKAYVARRVSEGKTRREAIRALKRYVARALFKLWTACFPPPLPPVTALRCT